MQTTVGNKIVIGSLTAFYLYNDIIPGVNGYEQYYIGKGFGSDYATQKEIEITNQFEAVFWTGYADVDYVAVYAALNGWNQYELVKIYKQEFHFDNKLTCCASTPSGQFLEFAFPSNIDIFNEKSIWRIQICHSI